MAPASVATHKTEFQTSQLTQLKQLTQLTRLEGDYISHETQRVKRLGICRGTCESIPVTSVGIKKIMFKTLTLKSLKSWHFCLWINSTESSNIPEYQQSTPVSPQSPGKRGHWPAKINNIWRNMAKHGETIRLFTSSSMSQHVPACPSLWTRLSLKKREANHTSARSARNSATIFTNRPHNPPMWGLKVWPKFPGHHLLWVDAGGRPECRNGPGIAAESVGPKETTQQNPTNPIPKVLKSFRMFQVSSHWISSYRNQTALRSQNKSENGDIWAWLKKALAGNVAPARTTTTSATSVGCCTAKKWNEVLPGTT